MLAYIKQINITTQNAIRDTNMEWRNRCDSMQRLIDSLTLKISSVGAGAGNTTEQQKGGLFDEDDIDRWNINERKTKALED